MRRLALRVRSTETIKGNEVLCHKMVRKCGGAGRIFYEQ